MQRFYSLRKPKTNVQILQQNVLLKFTYLVTFLRLHGQEVYGEVRQAYVDTMSRVLRNILVSYQGALERLQLTVASKSDLIGADDSRSGAAAAAGGGLFGRGKDNTRNKSSVFSLARRAAILRDVDAAQPVIVHQAEASGSKYPYEALFRSSHKLLMDTATSEYLFCQEFWQGDPVIFREIFSAPISVLESAVTNFVPTCNDAIGLLLCIRITHEHHLIMSRRRVPCLDSYFDKLNLLLWPRFKSIFDAQLASLHAAKERVLWSNDTRAHYVTRRYAEFTASMLSLSSGYGDGQMEANLDRLRGEMASLLDRMGKLFGGDDKSRLVFLINNYSLVLSVLKEGGGAEEDGAPRTQLDRSAVYQWFDEVLGTLMNEFIETELSGHFTVLISFVKKAETAHKLVSAGGGDAEGADASGLVNEAAPVMRDFAQRWKSAIEYVHKDVTGSFSNLTLGMDILQRTLSQLLIYYTRLTGPDGVLVRCGPAGAALAKEAISNPALLYEIKRTVAS